MRFALLIVMSLCWLTFASAHADAPSLDDVHAIAAADQADRADPSLTWLVISGRDAARRDAVRRLEEAGRLKTSADYHDAALVFQHGHGVVESEIAVGFADRARQLPHDAADDKSLNWLWAAATDRLLMRQDKPQWYGTQYVPSDDGTQWMLYAFDESRVSADERARLGLEPLAEITRSFPRKARPQ